MPWHQACRGLALHVCLYVRQRTTAVTERYASTPRQVLDPIRYVSIWFLSCPFKIRQRCSGHQFSAPREVDIASYMEARMLDVTFMRPNRTSGIVLRWFIQAVVQEKTDDNLWPTSNSDSWRVYYVSLQWKLEMFHLLSKSCHGDYWE